MSNRFNSIILVILISSSLIIADDEGLTNYQNKKYAEAKAYYERAISTIKDTSAVLLGLGVSQYQLGDIPNAAKSFEKALKSEDTEVQGKAYYNLGNSIYSQQKPKESVAFYRKVLEINPNDDDAKFNYELAKYQSQQQQQDQNQKNQDDQPNNQNQQNQDNQNNPQDQQQDTNKDEPDKQEDQDSDSSEQEQRETPKSQQQINAETILDALKDEEQIHQKVKMAQQSGRKFEKDW